MTSSESHALVTHLEPWERWALLRLPHLGCQALSALLRVCCKGGGAKQACPVLPLPCPTLHTCTVRSPSSFIHLFIHPRSSA